MIQNIKILAMDVDGTMTDGTLYITARGEEFKSFNVCDGLGIKSLQEKGIIPIILTGRKSPIVNRRAEELGIKIVFQEVKDKRKALMEFCKKNEINVSEVAYIGDDINDLAAISECGLSACPHDAHKKVRQAVDYVCEKCGGRGAVREFIDYISEIIGC